MNLPILRTACAAFLPAFAVTAPPGAGEAAQAAVTAVDQSAAGQRLLPVVGKYVGEAGKKIMQGQISVEVWLPRTSGGPIRR
jgi:hypothetical protein